MSISLDCTSDQGWKTLCAMRHQCKLAGTKFVVNTGPAPKKTITEKQFGALHVWCREVAETLNAAGLDMKKVLKPEFDIPWTKWSVKEYLYKPVLEALTGKTSTTEQDTVEPSAVEDIMARHLGDKFGVVLPLFPDKRRGAE